MNQEIVILQQSPRVEIVFYDDEFEMKKSGSVLIDKTKYSQLKNVEFIKGRIPWFTGILTAVVDLIFAHGVGQWKRGKGKLELTTNDHSYTVDLINYDREQTPEAVKLINDKFK
ncbi:MAG: hypothetical protein JJ885_16025 [Muricauda sp.]|nr:hypothetical protein [Allomuricauda sp.]MBO6533552.1 hypothetical protein [Allomuricauda sp.]MBO6845847.1 hypothetical protein [Allomuricauda sp.]